MDNKTQISVMMITKNRADFIASAIESVLAQSFSNWELIILDDNSNDDTENIVKRYSSKDDRIKYYKNFPTLGIPKSRNQGISLSTGKYIAVLDSDDKWEDAEKLKKQFDFLENNSDYVLVGSNIRIEDNKNNLIQTTNFATEDAEIRKKILTSNQIPHSTVLYRKDLINKIGGYDNNITYAEDLDLFLRLGITGKFKNLKEATTIYIRHQQAMTQKRKLSMSVSHFKIILKNFGKYPNWTKAMLWSILRILKNLL